MICPVSGFFILAHFFSTTLLLESEWMIAPTEKGPTERDNGPYTSEKMWSSSDRGQMLPRNML